MKYLILSLALGALVLTGCESNLPDYKSTTHGASAGAGYVYGTGPDKTKPYPQTEPVNIKGVPGAKPKYEPLSRGGNKDYTVLGQNYVVWSDKDSYQEIGTASWYGPGFHGNKTSNGEVYNQKAYTAAHKNLPLPSYVKVTNLENGKSVIVRVNDRGPFHGSRIIDLSESSARAIDMVGKGTAKVKLEKIDVRNGNNTTTSGIGAGAQGVIGSIINNSISSETKDKIHAIGSAVTTIGKVVNAVQKNGAKSSATPKGFVPTTASNYTPETHSSYSRTVSEPVVNNAGYDVAEITEKAYIQIFSSGSNSGAQHVVQKVQGFTHYPAIVVQENGIYRVRIGPVPNDDLGTTLEYMKQLGYGDSFVKHVP